MQPSSLRLCPHTTLPPAMAFAAANASASASQPQPHAQYPVFQQQQQQRLQSPVVSENAESTRTPTLLVLVVSRRAHIQERRLARSTWLRSSSSIAGDATTDAGAAEARGALRFVPKAGRRERDLPGAGESGSGAAGSSSSNERFGAGRELTVGHVFVVGRGATTAAGDARKRTQLEVELAAEARSFGDVLELEHVLENEHVRVLVHVHMFVVYESSSLRLYLAFCCALLLTYSTSTFNTYCTAVVLVSLLAGRVCGHTARARRPPLAHAPVSARRLRAPDERPPRAQSRLLAQHCARGARRVPFPIPLPVPSRPAPRVPVFCPVPSISGTISTLSHAIRYALLFCSVLFCTVFIASIRVSICKKR